ncbi:MAG: transposase [Bryobacteraceae bacterium]
MFFTWRLHGSLPPNRPFPDHLTSGRHSSVWIAFWMAPRTGPLYLRRREIANLVVESILFHQEGLNHYELYAYVVRAKHVHLLITPSVAVSKAMHSLKRFTARKANELLKLTGLPF